MSLDRNPERDAHRRTHTARSARGSFCESTFSTLPPSPCPQDFVKLPRYHQTQSHSLVNAKPVIWQRDLIGMLFADHCPDAAGFFSKADKIPHV